jgi:hypothetical protein
MRSRSTSRWKLTASRAAFGLLALAAIATQLIVHARLGLSVVNFFSYFTNLSNLFAAFTLLVAAAPANADEDRLWIETLRAIAVINMTLVGLVFSILLRNVDLGSLLPWVNWALHYVMPIFLIVDWIAHPPRIQLGRQVLLISLSFPLAYLAYILARGSATNWYPYPFLSPADAGGVAGVAAHVAGITVVYIFAAWVILALGKRRS